MNPEMSFKPSGLSLFCW